MRHSTGDQPTPGHWFNGDVAARRAADHPADFAGKKASERDALKLLLQQFGELREFASYYVAARIDGASASVRSAISRLVLAALGFIVVAGLIVMASGLVLNGLAQGVGKLFGQEAWIGTLLTGVAAIVGIGVGVRYAVAARNAGDRKKAVDKYEERQAWQRTRFGRDVEGREPTGAVGSD